MEPELFTPGPIWPGILRRILFVIAIPPLLKAWEGMGARIVTTGYGGPSSAVVTGAKAYDYGVLNLIWGCGLLVASFLVWYLWDRGN